jgi:chromosome segregation ATPase
MELELQGWKVKLALVALVLVVVAAPLARAVDSNRDRAEDWHRRAIVAEESVGGLRVVIVERSRALNRRTVQANQLVTELHSAQAALRRSKVNVGTLTRRQRALANENARMENERRKLQAGQAALETIASKLRTCTKGLGGVVAAVQGKRPRTLSASARSRLASCGRAGARLDAYLEQFG